MGRAEVRRRAKSQIERRLDAGEQMILAGHALAEAYSVLTRLPPPHRLPPDGAAALLDANLVAHALRVVSLDGRGYSSLVRDAPSRGVYGGRIYDAVVAATAVRGNVAALLTFNERHFGGLLPDEMVAAVPRG